MKFCFVVLGNLICFLCLTCCVPASRIPMETTSFQHSASAEHRTLLLFLPGKGDTTLSFENEGFLKAVRRDLPDADLIGVEAHLGYYLDHTIVTRLREDVIIPAKKTRVSGYLVNWRLHGWSRCTSL